MHTYVSDNFSQITGDITKCVNYKVTLNMIRSVDNATEENTSIILQYNTIHLCDPKANDTAILV